ncbi:uncharacterized protein LOC108624878 [Ceratina calcarata]|uniref:Uncharacterized protein LOC108624878 n=1 Tax=Ceratina calcarata TaxID=156304 RepID=A0AAJ7IZ39_9HYME|nr:uncharacterized protein LOC108624878 [Ceratina calcarata]
MNNIRVITFKLLRTYATKPDRAGIRKKAYLLKNSGTDFEDIDHEDGGMYETDFRDITKSYAERKREELIAKERLRQRIVKSKVFKDSQPRFLTYVEKEHIKKLHQSNPDEWTPERLSESFPALPETIRKILKVNWVPKTVEAIVKYDEKAIENWKNFKTGRLALNPALKEHLMKFKDRKISLIDRETLLEKFVPPKMELPEPKSSFFRSIVKDPTDLKKITRARLISSENTNTDDKNRVKRIEEKSVDVLDKKICDKHLDRETNNAKKYNSQGKTLSFDEFLKQKINNLNKTTPEERETLIATYKKQIESTSLSPSMLNDSARNVTVEKKDNDVAKKNSSDTSELAVKKTNTESKILAKANETCSSLDTHVKEHISYMETDYNYVNRIRIPRNVYKAGMTYRIKDCYYDDDGEFLYRVPGLRS